MEEVMQMDNIEQIWDSPDVENKILKLAGNSYPPFYIIHYPDLLSVIF